MNALGLAVKMDSGCAITKYDKMTMGGLERLSALTGNLQLRGLCIGFALALFWLASAAPPAASVENVYFFHNDHLGTPQAMSDASGHTVWTAEYEPFGNATVNQDPDGDGQIVINNLRFPGQYYDAESGLHYNYHRDYDPTTGRYLQPDPIGLWGGLNLYNYVESNPVNLIDPEGEAAGGALIGGWIGGGIGGLIGGIGGGGACTLVAPGVGTIGCGAAGGAQGAITGAAIGAAIGSAIEDVCTDAPETWDCELMGEGSVVTIPGAVVKQCQYTCMSNKGNIKGFTTHVPVNARCPYRISR